MKEILFPVGRFVGGSLYRGETKNEKGPLTFADGSPRTAYSFAVAFPKGAETHWNQTEWGRILWSEGAEAAPNLHQAPTFAWKVKDGDSQLPNRRGNKPCDQEGWPGHWVLWFSGSYAPKIFNKDGTQPITEENAVKPGYFIQVFGSVAFNKSNESPGVYINYNLVAFSAYGAEIELSSTPDASAVGFGQGALPPGATAAPTGGMSAPPTSTPAQAAPPAPGAPPAPHTGYMAPPAVFPPAGWLAHPTAPGYYYKGQEVLTEEQLRARA